MATPRRKVERLIFLSVWLAVGVGLVGPRSIQAQNDLRVVSTDPVEGATGVDLESTITFQFNNTLPQTGSAFKDKILWSPVDSTQLSIFGHDLDDSGSIRLIYYTLRHTADTDFSFIVFGVRDAAGRAMDRPFTLNYTTAASMGPHQVRGTASLEARSPSARTASARQPLRRFVATAFAPPPVHRDDVPPPSSARETLRRQPSTVGTIRAHASTAAARLELRRTVVLLLERYVRTPVGWVIRKAAVVDEDGSFALDGVRDGTYWPLAITFATEDGEEIGAYGFHDPDGDFAPDPIAVSDGAVPELELPLYAYEATTAKSSLAIAQDRADAAVDDQELIEMLALDGPENGTAFADGTALTWRYVFYSPTEDRLTFVDVDPINAYATTFPANEEDATRTPIPEDFPINSDQALTIADAAAGDAFRERYTEDVRVILRAGDLRIPNRPTTERPFWMVSYESPEGAPFDLVNVFVDMITGDVLDTEPVATETPPASYVVDVASSYPNPFREQTAIQYTLNQSMPVRLTVYDALGRRLAVLVDEDQPAGSHVQTWSAAGLPSGLYLYVLTTPTTVHRGTIVLQR